MSVSSAVRRGCLPPRVPDDRGCLVTQSVDGTSYIVTVPVPGVPLAGAMTLGQERAAGALLGRLHHLLSGYPLPSPRLQDDQAIFLTTSLHGLLQDIEADRCSTAVGLLGKPRKHLDLGVRCRQDIHRHLGRVRRRLPQDLTLHTVHGALPERLWFIGEALTGLTGFRAPTGYQPSSARREFRGG
jgi:hypothetical protein